MKSTLCLQFPARGRRGGWSQGPTAGRCPSTPRLLLPPRVGKTRQQHVGRGHSAAWVLTPAGVSCARPLGGPQPGKLSPALNLQLLTSPFLHSARWAYYRPARCAQLIALYETRWPRLPPRRAVLARVVCPGRPHPEPPFVSPPIPGCPPTHPGCSCPCRQRQPAAPSHEHCGAPRVCNAERRLRAARAGSAVGEGGRERGWRDARGGGGARATPTRARPRGSQGQSACAGGAEPSAGCVHWPGPRRPTLPDPDLRPSLQNSGGGPPHTGGGKRGTQDLSGKLVPTEHPWQSVCSGCRSLPVSDPLPTTSWAAHTGQALLSDNAQTKSHSQHFSGVKLTGC